MAQPQQSPVPPRAGGAGRGRLADRPPEIPARGWIDILTRSWESLRRHNLSLISAGIAYHALFAMFPALAAMVSVYGLVASPADVERQVAALAVFVPADALAILRGQLHALAAAPGAKLGLSLLFSLGLALWGAMGGVDAIIVGLNAAYDEQEKRGFVRLTLTALGLTVGAIVFLVLALVLVAALPGVLGYLGLGAVAETLLALLRWPLLAAAVMFGLAVVYRFGPSRDHPRWRWVSYGAAVATVAWLAGSAGFSFYVAHFGSYNKTYGSVGAVVVLLAWLYLTAFVVLVGAQLNAEMEHQTIRDTTVGPPQPLGQRGARMADTVGRGGRSVRRR